MTAQFTLVPEAVATAVAESKASILAQLAARFATAYGLDGAEVLSSIEHRERLGSTGFGRGAAIPHARLDRLGRPVAVFLRLDQPVEFDAADGREVDLVFGLLSPTQAGARHLHALAAISRLMRDEAMHAAIAGVPNAEAIYGLLSNVIDRDAA